MVLACLGPQVQPPRVELPEGVLTVLTVRIHTPAPSSLQVPLRGAGQPGQLRWGHRGRRPGLAGAGSLPGRCGPHLGACAPAAAAAQDPADRHPLPHAGELGR